MLSRAFVSSLLLAALANGLVFKRDDGYSTSTPLPTVTPQPILLPDPSISLSLPPLDPSSTDSLTVDPSLGPSISLPDPSLSLPLPTPSISLSLPPLDSTSTDIPSTTSLPDPSFSVPDPSISISLSLPPPSISLSLPPLDSTSTVTFSTSSLPSVVTTTVYVYPTECSPSGVPTPVPTPIPTELAGLPQDDPITLPPLDPSITVSLPGQETPLVLPPVRRDNSVVDKVRALEQQVVSTWVDLGKGNNMMSVIGQLESIIAQAAAPGADGAALLKQAQSLVYN